jgi:hypothetical protein
MQCDSIFRILIITAYRFYIKQLFNFKIVNIHLFDLIHFTISDSAEKDNDAKENKGEFTVRGGLSFGKRMARPFLQEKGQLVRVTVEFIG